MNIPNLWRTRSQRYRLCSTYCVTCGAVFFPPRPVCPHCCHLSAPVLAPAETAGLMLETRSAPVYTDFEWKHPYPLPLFQTNTTGSVNR